MSSMPPNPPPGGGVPPPPIPPYDPSSQWRGYRAQQKAAWRAQRDAWKAQQRAMKARYISACGPRVPSVVGPVLLIAIGILALLVYSGRIAVHDLWAWYGRWWPLLLIGAGLLLLGEWALDLRRPAPVRRGGGFVGVLILLALLGVAAAGWDKMGRWRSQWGDQENDFFNALGLPEHDLDQTLSSGALSAKSASMNYLEIDNPRGDVSVSAGNVSTIEVQAHEVAYTGSDADAKNIFDAEAVKMGASENPGGQTIVLRSVGNSKGRVNLVVTVPVSVPVTITAGRGDVTAAGLGAGIRVSASGGDLHLSGITGSVEAHLLSGRHDFSARQIDGNLAVDGEVNDINLSEIKGKVTQTGEILGNVHIENVSGSIHLHTSVTDLEVAGLPGDLTLSSDSLHINEARGTVRVATHSKDIDLSQIYGDSHVEDRDGSISIEPAGNYAIEAKNSKGDVEVTLPASASATIEGRARNGDIITDFGLTVSGAESKTVSGMIGSGAARIDLGTENGDLRIKKGADFPLPAPSPAAPPNHRHPSLSGAPRLRPSLSPPPQPVTQ